MNFLYCIPSVFVIGKEYEILVNTKENGIVCLLIDGKRYYEENSGVLFTEKKHAKIRIPQNVLNSAKQYTVAFKKTIDRKAYFSLMAEEEYAQFSFKPLEKRENIHLYHVADVHYGFETAKKTADYFGKDIDVFVINGDIGEVETIENYLETCKFVGDISHGEIPVIFVRGNHDTRGKLAELYTTYFPANGQKTYYDFELGVLKGIALDLGEDKKDDHYDEAYPNPDVYGGVNNFEIFREKELAWLKELALENKDSIVFAVSHICPVQTTQKPGGVFDIERERYTAMNAELERLNIQFMLCGHLHKTFVLEPNDPASILPHNYPVVVGSELINPQYLTNGLTVSNFYGAAITINRGSIEVAFTDQNHEIIKQLTVQTKI